MPSLLFYRNDEKLFEFRLPVGRISIGRSDACDVSLPGDAISRTHCLIESGIDGWQMTDRSRHGTTLDGERVSRAPLFDGSAIGIGGFTIHFRDLEQVAPPTADALPSCDHEQLLAADGALHLSQARLRVIEGPAKGLEAMLRRPRMSIGGAGSNIVISDPDLKPRHCRMRVCRGRVMLEPGEGATWLDGQLLRDITPLFPDEEFQLGQTTVKMDIVPIQITPSADRFGEMISKNEMMHRVFGMLRRLSGHDDPILIVGESGTGKELAARGIHEHSPRASGPFVPINCASIPAEVFESELFGHEKGAFTGALSRKDGAFQNADGGTLFLDEIGELPLLAQAKLLRALGGVGIRRVGSFVIETPDVRVIAATNRDLPAMVRDGSFRDDLFFRLETLFVELPPLRDRGDDIALLSRHLSTNLSPAATISPAAMAMLKTHDWQGNVRELRNVIRRAIVMYSPNITPQALTFHELKAAPVSMKSGAELEEREVLVRMLRRHSNNRSAVARALGLSRSGLLYKLQKAGLL